MQNTERILVMGQIENSCYRSDSAILTYYEHDDLRAYTSHKISVAGLEPFYQIASSHACRRLMTPQRHSTEDKVQWQHVGE